ILVTLVNSQIAVRPRIYGIAALSAADNSESCDPTDFKPRSLAHRDANLFPSGLPLKRIVAEIRRGPESGTSPTLGNATVQRQRSQHLQSMCGILFHASRPMILADFLLSRDCLYRVKNRDRPRKVTAEQRQSSPAQENASSSSRRENQNTDRPEELDRGLTAVHHPGMEDSTQLFYGPTSNFAFIQQIHRGVLLKAAEKQASNSSKQTNEGVAEAFYAQAKVCAAPFEDAVTLTMIQFSLLCADYQCNLGRPNSAYMQLGAACRRAFAFGLHKEGATSRLREDEFKKRRVTMWCLYFYERWIALSLGRKSSLQIADISSGPLEDQSLVACLARMANIVERDVGSMYEGGPHTLQELYHAADKAHHNLREFGETLRIGSRNMFPSLPPASDNIATLQFHNLYYLSILLIFRPFLIAESALRTKSSSAPGEMWLRQACRCAIDAAQDYLVFASGLLKSSDICKRPRYTTFFIESSCAVLLHDVLSHPSKYAYHLEYIQLATETLESMLHDDPVLNAQRSIRRILQAVERAISAPSLPASSSSETNPSSEPSSSSTANPQPPPPDPSAPVLPNPYGHGTSVQFPSLQPQAHATSEDLIYLSDR
ncbi:hypothetical protein D0866_13967, partial [Hortaea werneckii]